MPDYTVSLSSNTAEVCALGVLLAVACVDFFFSFLLQTMRRGLLAWVMCVAKYCSWVVHVTGPIKQKFRGRFIR